MPGPAGAGTPGLAFTDHIGPALNDAFAESMPTVDLAGLRALWQQHTFCRAEDRERSHADEFDEVDGLPPRRPRPQLPVLAPGGP